MNAKRTQDEKATLAWLNAPSRNGHRRIEVLGWKRLARLYRDSRPGGSVRKAICAEARKCGYTPRTILAFSAE